MWWITASCLLAKGTCSHLKVTWTLMDVWQASETSHSKSSLANFQHQYLAELLVNVYSYRSMVKSVSCCCARGRLLFSNPVTYTVYQHIVTSLLYNMVVLILNLNWIIEMKFMIHIIIKYHIDTQYLKRLPYGGKHWRMQILAKWQEYIICRINFGDFMMKV